MMLLIVYYYYVKQFGVHRHIDVPHVFHVEVDGLQVAIK